jgi:uncharacterized protein YcaQ
VTLDELRRFAVVQTLFAPTTLPRALRELGFVQADPIRAPARAQDLTLRHRVRGYRAGDLERLYPRLGVEEDFFINYGFVTRELHALMHPRPDTTVYAAGAEWPALRRKRARLVFELVRERGPLHPRVVDEHLGLGRVKNYWGGTSNATTHLLDALHYIGHLRVARRDSGVRIYAARDRASSDLDPAERDRRLDAMVDVVMRLYAPLPASSFTYFVRRLRYAVPQWKGDLTAAIGRAKARLVRERVGGVEWVWPDAGDARTREPEEIVRLLAPFDPIVQDRTRFELLWGWEYRFEAYTPRPKRKLGYYALPLLWGERVIGWANLSFEEGTLTSELGYVSGRPPRERAFARELEAELERMRAFLTSPTPRARA